MPEVVVPFPRLSAAALAPDSRRRFACIRQAEGKVPWRAWVSWSLVPGSVRTHGGGYVDAGLDASTRLDTYASVASSIRTSNVVLTRTAGIDAYDGSTYVAAWIVYGGVALLG